MAKDSSTTNGAPPADTSSEIREGRRRHSLSVAAAVLFASAIALTVLVEQRDPVKRLAEAASNAHLRLTQGRLSGWAYAPYSLSRGSDREPGVPFRFASVALSVRADVVRGSTTSLHAAGIAELASGDLDAAATTLASATASNQAPAAVWSDLSAVYLDRNARESDPRDAARSIAAADQALRLDPERAEAWFNRAIALERLGLVSASAAAFERFISLDERSAWANEAREHLQRLSQQRRSAWPTEIETLRAVAVARDDGAVAAVVSRYPQQGRTWSETVFLAEWGANSGRVEGDHALALARAIGAALRERNGESLLSDAVSAIDEARMTGDATRLGRAARGHVLYDRGRQLYRLRNVEDALRLFLEAKDEFIAARSPMSEVSEYYAASARFDSNELSLAQGSLHDLLRRLPRHYIALRAQIHWELGTIFANRGDLLDAEQSYRRAIELYANLGETENEMSVRTAAARVVALLGRSRDAWKLRQGVFSNAAKAEKEETLLGALASAGRDALTERDWVVAGALLTVALDEQAESAPVNLRRRVDLLVSRAIARSQLRQLEDALNDIARASLAAASIESRGLADAALNDVWLAEARIVRDSEPARAARILDGCISFAQRSGKNVMLEEMYLERARARRRTGDVSGSVADLSRGFEIVEKRRSSFRIQGTDEYAASGRDIYGDLTDTLVAADPGRAFEVADRGRSRAGLDASLPSLTVASMQRALPPGTLLVHYTVRPGEIIVFAATTRAFISRRVAVGSRADLQTGGTLLEAVSPLLPNARRIIFVPDRGLHRAAFAALVNPATGRMLIEQAAVVVAPSAAFYVKARNETGRRRLMRALAIGDPSFDTDFFHDLPRLPAAAKEAAEVAALYPSSLVLIGDRATAAAFHAGISDADVVQIGAHARTSSRNPSLSALLLAREGDESGIITARSVMLSTPPRNRLVILAGCRTGEASDEGGSAGSLAFAFLAAGSATVVGSVRDVDDEVSRRFSVAFHKLVLGGAAPADAVRLVQLSMIQSGNSALADSRVWSAFQAYGTGD